MTERGLGRASALVASGTLVSRLLGFVKAWLLSIAVGTVASGDAYAAATLVPNNIYAILGGGLFTAVLVPQIVRASARNDDGGAAYINKLATIALVALLGVGVAATVASPLLLPVFVRLHGASLDLAVAFGYWSLPQVFFLGVYAVLGEVLVARKLFWPYMWAPVLNNIVAIAAIGLFLGVWGPDPVPSRDPASWTPAMIATIAGGGTLGIAVQALVLGLAWRQVGLRFRPDFRWRGVQLGSAGQAAAWTFAMLLVTQIAGAIESNVSSLASGKGAANAAMSYSWLIFMLPHSIITVSLVTVFYPRMSESASRGDLTTLRTQFVQSLRLVLLPIVGATAVLIATSIPLARVFTTDATNAARMAAVLVAYLIGLPAFTALFVVQRVFYALADTKTPFLYTLAQGVLVSAGVLACALLPPLYIAAAVALVVSIGTMLQLAFAWMLLRPRLGPPPARALRPAINPWLLAVIYGFAGYAAFQTSFWIVDRLGAFDAAAFAVSGRLAGVIVTAIAATAGFAVYLALLRLFRIPELRTATGLITARFRRRPGE